MTTEEIEHIQVIYGHVTAMLMAQERRVKVLAQGGVSPQTLNDITSNEAAIGRILREDVEWLLAALEAMLDTRPDSDSR